MSLFSLGQIHIAFHQGQSILAHSGSDLGPLSTGPVDLAVCRSLVLEHGDDGIGQLNVEGLSLAVVLNGQRLGNRAVLCVNSGQVETGDHSLGQRYVLGQRAVVTGQSEVAAIQVQTCIVAVVVGLLGSVESHRLHSVHGYLEGSGVVVVLDSQGLLTGLGRIKAGNGNALCAQVHHGGATFVLGDLQTALGVIEGVANQIVSFELDDLHSVNNSNSDLGGLATVGDGNGLLAQLVGVITGGSDALGGHGDILDLFADLNGQHTVGQIQFLTLRIHLLGHIAGRNGNLVNFGLVTLGIIACGHSNDRSDNQEQQQYQFANFSHTDRFSNQFDLYAYVNWSLLPKLHTAFCPRQHPRCFHRSKLLR